MTLDNTKYNLKPCPFCGGTKINGDLNSSPSMLFCWGCGATMSYPTADKTIKAWNKRPQ